MRHLYRVPVTYRSKKTGNYTAWECKARSRREAMAMHNNLAKRLDQFLVVTDSLNEISDLGPTEPEERKTYTVSFAYKKGDKWVHLKIKARSIKEAVAIYHNLFKKRNKFLRLYKNPLNKITGYDGLGIEV